MAIFVMKTLAILLIKVITRIILEDIRTEIGRNATKPFVHNFTRYYKDGKIPLYAVIELFSFGMLSKFYSNMQSADKKAIAKIDFNVGYTYLESWLESISFVRNTRTV